MLLEYDKKTYLTIEKQPLAGSTFTNWIRVLIENKFDINWRFLPRAIYVTLMIVVTTPLRLHEKKKFDRKIKDIKIEQPIFIIGHWRSGTTFLHYLLGQDKNLAYTSTMATLDPSIFLEYEKLLRSIISKSLPHKRPMDNLEMKTDLPYEEEYAVANLCPYSFYHAWYFPKNMDRYFDKYVLFKDVNKEIIDAWRENYTYFLKKVSYKHGGKQIMLKSLVNTARIKHILELFPDAEFIHLYRNPYEVYMSTWKLYKSILPLFSFQQIDKDKLDQSILNVYKKLYKRYLKDRSLIPEGNLIEISYENFVKKPLETVEKIYSTFKINSFEKAKPSFKKYIRKHENYKRNHHRLDDKIREKVYKEWGFVFKEFGYIK